MRKKLSNFPIIKFLTSAKLVVVCLILLFVLTLGGTIYQIEHGLYLAQERFFNSFFFFIFNVIPFPGAQLVMWVLFINLVVVLLFRFVYKWPQVGILVIHFGILLFLISAFVVHYDSTESHLTLMENEGSSVSADYNDWELAVWTKDGKMRNVVAYDTKHFVSKKILSFNEFGFDLIIKSYYQNCKAYTTSDVVEQNKIISASDIHLLKEETTQGDPTKNTPGGIFTLAKDNTLQNEVILYGQDEKATSILIKGDLYYFMLRHKRYPLPFVLKLIDFRMQKHPGTEVARSYESLVELTTPELTRQTVIFMNNPLRYKEYTLYQASYSIDPNGRESSTLAVVKNRGRILPYVATFTTFFGLATHFILMFFASLKRRSS